MIVFHKIHVYVTLFTRVCIFQAEEEQPDEEVAKDGDDEGDEGKLISNTQETIYLNPI